MLIGIVWAAATGISWGLIRLGVQRNTAVRSVFVAVVVLMSAGRILRQLGPTLGWLAVLSIMVLAVVAFSRLGDDGFVNALVWGLAVALMSGVAIASYGSVTGSGQDLIVNPTPVEIEMAETPDVFIVILDGYPGLITLQRESADLKKDLRDALAVRGFQIPSSAWSSYWSTDLSVSSLLNMSYPVVEAFDGSATTQGLYDIISGDNALLRTLERNGYTTHMVESGWSGSACGPEFDRCVPAPLLDEAMYLTVWDTALGPLMFSSLGHTFTVGTQRTMEWLLENAALMSQNENPDLVVTHLIAPHPPFFLDENCQRAISLSRGGPALYFEGVPKLERETYFADQMACVDRFMIELADVIDSDAVVVFVADHGTARYRQLNIPPEAWEYLHFVERLNVFVSVRIADGCEIGEVVIVPNLLRRVLTCYSDDVVSDIQTRMFISPLFEVDEDTIESLLTERAP